MTVRPAAALEHRTSPEGGWSSRDHWQPAPATSLDGDLRRRPLHLGLHSTDEITGQGLRVVLAPYADRAELVADADLLPPAVDILLVQVRPDGATGPEQVRSLIDDGFDRVVALGPWPVVGVRQRLLAAGAAEYVTMQLGATQLLDVLESVVDTDGSSTLPPALSRRDGLSEREAEVLVLVARGFSNPEIARELHLSINTVKTYLRGAYRKIGATSRSRAVIWGIEHAADL